jgi:tRNA/rRNA methyltransferase
MGWQRHVASLPAPIVILVRPQMGENIGMAARAMANFGLRHLRLVAPRDGWGEGSEVRTIALDAAVSARGIVEEAPCFADVHAAIADCHKVFATTARERGQAKPVLGGDTLAVEAVARAKAGERIAVLFGPERTGLDNDEVNAADAIVSYPVDPAFPSLNLAQAVGIMAYEWRKAAEGSAPPFAYAPETLPATREMAQSFFDYLVRELDEAGYFLIDGKEDIMRRNLVNILHRIEMTEADVRTLRGAVTALAEGRRKRGKAHKKP